MTAVFHRASSSGWDRASWALIALHTILLLSWWPLLPFFVDSYYHLNVLQGFRDAGGVVLHAFWELAPTGRPHLYPPALHAGLLALDRLRLDPITLARLASVAPYPLLLLTTWWCARQWLGRRAAYWATLCGVLPWSYLLVTSNTIAASWAMIGWLLSLAAARRGARLACALCGTLVFYAHLGTPWLMLCSWLLLAAADASLRRTLAWSAALTLLLSSPWLWHLWTHRGLLGSLETYENRLVEIPLAVYGLAAAGLAAAFRRRDLPGRREVLSLAVALLPLLLHYRYRFFSGQGLLGVCLLAGMGAAALQEAMERRWDARLRAPWVVPAGLTLALIALHPVWFAESGRVLLGDTALSHLALQDERMPRSNAVTFYYPRLVDPLVQVIDRETRADELLGCNLPATCGMLAALSHRATTTGMLAEVRPEQAAQDRSPLRQARLIVWLKGQDGPAAPSLPGLQRVTETDMATVWRNPAATARRQAALPALPLWAAQGLLGIALMVIAADLLRRRRTRIPL